MSEEIKQDEMVWVRDNINQDWKVDKSKYIAECKNGTHLLWCPNMIGVEHWNFVTTKNPHEKKCELLKEGEELWEYKDGQFGECYLNGLQGRFFKRLQGFVVELGNGKQAKVDYPIKWTGIKGALADRFLSSTESVHYSEKCKIIGAIMSEQKQC